MLCFPIFEVYEMVKGHRFYLVDAFTDQMFTGNPACVLLGANSLEEEVMQKIAREFNLSETAFPIPHDNTTFKSANHFHLRWFSPIVEVPLCGHATLATAHVLYSELANTNSSLSFTTQSGTLIVSKRDERYVMDFPRGEVTPIDFDTAILSALHLQGESVQNMMYCPNPNKLLIEVDNEKRIRDLSPEFDELIEISHRYDVGSIIVTAVSNSTEYDFISRNFAPIRGVNEDPVTGSAHVILGPYWQEKLGKNKLRAYQASNRGGFMDIEVKESERVFLIGIARTIAEGTLHSF
jgi:PhzF family phenazine biosynthesis protein